MISRVKIIEEREIWRLCADYSPVGLVSIFATSLRSSNSIHDECIFR